MGEEVQTWYKRVNFPYSDGVRSRFQGLEVIVTVQYFPQKRSHDLYVGHPSVSLRPEELRIARETGEIHAPPRSAQANMTRIANSILYNLPLQ